ncbi:MAG: Uncharacterised protein [Cyanobium sp. ARS6]|nr:MAG: Uncharacterised protein [Cyanobium sp. ARS6]
MTVMDQACERFGLQWIAAVELQPFLGDGLQQRLAHIWLNQKMIRCDTGLPGIESFPPDKPAGRDGEVCTRQHDCGILAAELQCHGGEVGCGTLKHLGSNRSTTGEEDVVEALPDQLRGDGPIAVDHLHHIVCKVLGHQLRDQLCCCRGMFGGFDHSGVAGRQGAHQGPQRETERQIPRADQQHTSEWLPDQFGTTRPLHERYTDPARSHPGTKASFSQLELLQQGHHLGHAFQPGLGKVMAQGFEDLRLVLGHQLTQPLKLFPSPCLRSGDALEHGLAQAIQVGVGECGCSVGQDHDGDERAVSAGHARSFFCGTVGAGMTVTAIASTP